MPPRFGEGGIYKPNRLVVVALSCPKQQMHEHGQIPSLWNLESRCRMHRCRRRVLSAPQLLVHRLGEGAQFWPSLQHLQEPLFPVSTFLVQ